MVIQIIIVVFVTVLSVFAYNIFSPKQPAVLLALSSQKEVEVTPMPTPLPAIKVLATDYHIFQSFNNCGPASLSMALSYFNIQKSQEELGQELRPYQVVGGDNDDKSVTLDELAEKAEEYGLAAYHRPNGDIEMLRKFIAADIPVITRTWLHADEDIGHYRVVKGYDTNAKTLLQDDSFQDKNLTYSYDDFDTIWEKFNYEYLVIVPKDKKHLAENILGENILEEYAWGEAKKSSVAKLIKNPSSIYDRFNLSVAYFHLGDYRKSVEEFEKVQTDLPFRTLWYQIEPIKAYYELGNYDKVLAISDQILNNQNRAYSELYLFRGQTYEKQENKDAARVEYENAVFYNTNLKEAQEALAKI